MCPKPCRVDTYININTPTPDQLGGRKINHRKFNIIIFGRREYTCNWTRAKLTTREYNVVYSIIYGHLTPSKTSILNIARLQAQL